MARTTTRRHTRRPAPVRNHDTKTAPLLALPKVSEDPFAGPAGRTHFACDTCETTWAGAEADCWNCGRPATTEHPNLTAALQLLLHRPAAHRA
ncbi:hypothetical protein ACIQWA_36535 [Kitasatospora sp. NPDC098652]|uniref:hypothetical protein n=1 Tax=Kitasatospora sp. NPDC098652 TaxID=3364095 RepID=UPI0037FE75A0